MHDEQKLESGQVYRHEKTTYVVVMVRAIGTVKICAVHDNGAYTFGCDIPKDALPCTPGNDNKGETPAPVRELIKMAVSFALNFRKD